MTREQSSTLTTEKERKEKMKVLMVNGSPLQNGRGTA